MKVLFWTPSLTSDSTCQRRHELAGQPPAAATHPHAVPPPQPPAAWRPTSDGPCASCTRWTIRSIYLSILYIYLYIYNLYFIYPTFDGPWSSCTKWTIRSFYFITSTKNDQNSNNSTLYTHLSMYLFVSHYVYQSCYLSIFYLSIHLLHHQTGIILHFVTH